MAEQEAIQMQFIMQILDVVMFPPTRKKKKKACSEQVLHEYYLYSGSTNSPGWINKHDKQVKYRLL